MPTECAQSKARNEEQPDPGHDEKLINRSSEKDVSRDDSGDYGAPAPLSFLHPAKDDNTCENQHEQSKPNTGDFWTYEHRDDDDENSQRFH